jgi:hypothetical protein
MQPATDSVSFHPDADQVIGLEHLQRLRFSQGHLGSKNLTSIVTKPSEKILLSDVHEHFSAESVLEKSRVSKGAALLSYCLVEDRGRASPNSTLPKSLRSGPPGPSSQLQSLR